MMKKGERSFAIRKALTLFDEWNKITGVFDEYTSYYSEIEGLIEDAVKIGSKVALYGINADLKNLDKSDE
jgi:hypothetical protein